MTTLEIKRAKIGQLKEVIWYNNPLHPGLFSACVQGPTCTNPQGARDGGLCETCATTDLAFLVGHERAQRFLHLVHDIRKLERLMSDLPSP